MNHDIIFLNYHQKVYPKMMSTDKIKLIYQGTLGPRHVGDLSKDQIRSKILKEAMEIPNSHPYQDIYEWISEKYLRINIFPFLEINGDYAYNLEFIVNSFYGSLKINDSSVENLKDNIEYYLNKDDYKYYTYKPLHHSKYYEDNYEPRYRLISKDYLSFQLREVQLKNFVERQLPYTIIALEGKCASGKNTITKSLNSDYTVIHMDDFFLTNEEKTDERLTEIGGNINYELVSKTIDDIKDAWRKDLKEISIKAFDCKKQEYYDKNIKIKNNKLVIEGVYSSHPFFRNKINKIAYIYVTKDDQIKNLRLKNISQKYYNKYVNEWMPLEDKYFDAINILSICDIII